MGKLTQYTGGLSVEGETAVAQWIGTEGCIDDLEICRGTYLRIQEVSVTNVNVIDDDYDPAFLNTLYFIQE